MQKKLLAAAVVSALSLPTLALADSANVNISGDLRVSIDSYKLGEGDSGSGEKYYAENRVVDNGSRIILSGTEEIGNGWKAHFYIDSRLAFDLGATGPGTGISAGNAVVGLQHDSIGKFSLGRWDSLYVDMAAIELYRTLPLVTFMGLGPMMQNFDGTALAPASRIPNMVMWDSPTWSGVTARFGISTNPDGNEGTGEAVNGSRGGAYFGNVKYAGGPIVAGVSVYLENQEGAGDAGDTEQYRAWVGYTFPFGLKVGLGIDKSEKILANNTPAVERTGYMIPITYSMGAHNF